MVFKSTRGCSEVSHLAYADDVIIFTQAASETIRRIKGCLDTYSDVSGQQINLSKSNFYIAENNEDWASSIESEGGFSKGSFPFLYLGVPIFKGAKRTDMFLFLRDKIARRVNGWAHRHLSFGGRLTLIKSTLEAIPIHVFQAIEPTKGALKALEQQMARFFWGAVDGKRKTHWIGWEQICLPTGEGGLGLRRMEDVLKAFNAKLWWRFREQNSLWATHMHAKYCSRKSPLASVGSSRNSATWRRLTAAWPIAHQNMRWIIGEGKILFWDDIWLGDKPLRELCLDTRGRSTSRVADFWSEGHWDHAKIWLAQHQSGMPTQVAEEILSVPILTGSADIPRWTLDRKGEFTVTSAWEATRARRMTIPALGGLWNEGLTGSMSIFMWRLLSNRIPVDAKLQWRNISLASKCQCCSERPGNETLQHLFVEGQGASQVWRYFDCWFEGQSEPLLHSDSIPTRLERWAKRTRQTAKAHLARVAPCLIFWFLWAERNNCRHNGVRFRAYSVIWQVQMHIQRGVESGRLKAKHFAGVKAENTCTVPSCAKIPSQKVMVIKWHPPDLPGLKLNTRGIFNAVTHRGGCGGIIRDHQGKLVSAFHKPTKMQSELETELDAIHEGLLRAPENGERIWIESNSHQAVGLLKSGAWGPASARQILTKVRLLSRGRISRISYVHRDGNKAADLLARLGADTSTSQEFDDTSAPRQLRAVIQLERNGTPYISFCEDPQE